MLELAEDYLRKARESLAGAQSELANGRYDNCANRCYYTCFQAAISALIRARVVPSGSMEEWGHDFVQAQFIGQLVNRRKVYGTDLRGTLEQNYRLRQVADYRRDSVSAVRAARAVGRAEHFFTSIAAGQGRVR